MYALFRGPLCLWDPVVGYMFNDLETISQGKTAKVAFTKIILFSLWPPIHVTCFLYDLDLIHIKQLRFYEDVQ
jgi:hypothetical protein